MGWGKNRTIIFIVYLDTVRSNARQVVILNGYIGLSTVVAPIILLTRLPVHISKQPIGPLLRLRLSFAFSCLSLAAYWAKHFSLRECLCVQGIQRLSGHMDAHQP